MTLIDCAWLRTVPAAGQVNLPETVQRMGDKDQTTVGAMNTISIAWLSRGKLFVRHGEQAIREIESDFAMNALEREMRSSQKNSWKERSGVWGSLGMEPPGLAPWAANIDPRRMMRIAALARGDSPDELFYVLDMGVVGGLFKYDLQRNAEIRLMHRQGFLASDIARHPEDGALAVSMRRDDGTSGLTITRHDGLFGKDVTVSDSIDEAPRWLLDGTKRLVFQSSAIGRDENGIARGRSPYRIEMLNLDTKETESLVEEEGFDLLLPQMAPDGSLHYVRRPYQAALAKPVALMDIAKDVLFFPYRLARTFIFFFNFVSVAVSGKPLISAGGNPQQLPQNNPVKVLYGQAVDTRLAMAKGAGKDEARPLVPKDWELVRLESDGRESVLATSVMHYDISSDGTIVYTDGRRIFVLTADGQSDAISKSDMIERVMALR